MKMKYLHMHFLNNKYFNFDINKFKIVNTFDEL